MKTKLVAAALALASGLLYVQTASAAVCGSSDPGSATNGNVRGTVELQDESVTELAYKRETDPETLLLVFKVAGCEVAADASDPDIDVLPRKGSKQLPDSVVKLLRARPDGTELSLRFSVDAPKFEPGSYGALLETRGPYLVTSRTPISLSRSEDNWAKPFGIGAASGLIAILWFGLLKYFAREKLKIKWPWLIVVAIAAAIFGGLAVASAWWDQDVWSVNENLKAAIVTGIAGATTGTMASLLGVVWQAPSK